MTEYRGLPLMVAADSFDSCQLYCHQSTQLPARQRIAVSFTAARVRGDGALPAVQLAAVGSAGSYPLASWPLCALVAVPLAAISWQAGRGVLWWQFRWQLTPAKLEAAGFGGSSAGSYQLASWKRRALLAVPLAAISWQAGSGGLWWQFRWQLSASATSFRYQLPVPGSGARFRYHVRVPRVPSRR